MTAPTLGDESFDDVSTEELCADIEALHDAENQVVKGFVLGFDVGQAEDQRAWRDGWAAGMAKALEDFATPTPAPYVAPRFHEVWDLHPASRETKRRRPRMAGVR